MKKSLLNKTAIITGASQGLGLVIAQHFLMAGANVVICARNPANVAIAVEKLEKQCLDNRVIGVVADISQPSDCKNVVDTCLREFYAIDILVNNAGIHGGKGPTETVDWQAWEQAIEVNLKGTVMMCRLALPIMKKNQAGKIIILSGGGATKPRPFMSAYAASKGALVCFSETLSEEVKSFGIDVNAIAPGAINTQLLEDVLKAGPEMVGKKNYQEAIAFTSIPNDFTSSDN